MTTKNEAMELAQVIEKLASPVSYANLSNGFCTEIVETLRSQASEIERLRESHQAACLLIADMHLAAMGAVMGPVLGVVEDVAALRTERDQLKAKNEKLVEASTFALELLDFIRKGCESGAVKSKPFITPDPDAKSLELMTIHGECVKAIKALKENT